LLPTRRVALSILAFLCAVPFTLAGDATLAALHLSVSVDRRKSVPVLEVTIENASQQDWILPLGYTFAGRTHPARFQILLSRANGKPATVLYRRGSGIAGRVDRSFITLLSGSKYSLRLPTDDYVVSETNQLLSELSGYRATVQVQYRPEKTTCPQTLDCRNRTLLGCWTGSMTSNTAEY
jgi:hypothetical protein